jgi:late competence protein required for DNA uptake (superfamily II DNA/RNA helicase)
MADKNAHTEDVTWCRNCLNMSTRPSITKLYIEKINIKDENGYLF